MILSGVKSVTLHDTATASLADLGAQYFLTEQVLPLMRKTHVASSILTSQRSGEISSVPTLSSLQASDKGDFIE